MQLESVYSHFKGYYRNYRQSIAEDPAGVTKSFKDYLERLHRQGIITAKQLQAAKVPGLKRIPIELRSIIKALQEFQSFELEGSQAVYYLHLTDDGQPVQYRAAAQYTYTAARDISAYDAMKDPGAIYESEVMTDPTFTAMIQTMIAQVNAGGIFEVIQ